MRNRWVETYDCLSLESLKKEKPVYMLEGKVRQSPADSLSLGDTTERPRRSGQQKLIRQSTREDSFAQTENTGDLQSSCIQLDTN
jgi:hypothetical protein